MKKMNYLLVAASVIVFAMLGLESVNAQTLRPTANGNSLEVKFPPLVTGGEAVDILSQRSKFLGSNLPGLNAMQEVESVVKIDYYRHILEDLLRGKDTTEAVQESIRQLYILVGHYNQTFAPDPQAIFNETVNLLTL